jgi:hypothetical protein
MYLQYNHGEESLALPTGIFSTRYRAEKEALTVAANKMSQTTNRTHGPLVIFTDALSVLQAVQSSRSKELNELMVEPP